MGNNVFDEIISDGFGDDSESYPYLDDVSSPNVNDSSEVDVKPKPERAVSDLPDEPEIAGVDSPGDVNWTNYGEDFFDKFLESGMPEPSGPVDNSQIKFVSGDDNLSTGMESGEFPFNDDGVIDAYAGLSVDFPESPETTERDGSLEESEVIADQPSTEVDPPEYTNSQQSPEVSQPEFTTEQSKPAIEPEVNFEFNQSQSEMLPELVAPGDVSGQMIADFLDPVRDIPSSRQDWGNQFDENEATNLNNKMNSFLSSPFPAVAIKDDNDSQLLEDMQAIEERLNY